MLRLWTKLALASVVALGSRGTAFGAQASPAGLDFREAYEVIRAHLFGATDADLNRAAVEGLLSALSPKVLLAEAPATNAPEALVSKRSVFDGAVAYLRLGVVAAGLPTALRGAYDTLAASNHLNGIVLDLRYARGTDYQAAVGAADLFLEKERPLLNWGQGVAQSTSKTNRISVPVAVLVNRQTGGAAEALAAMLQEAGAGLVLGGRTAGQALRYDDFALKNGVKLRIAVASIQLGDGSALAEGVKPDIHLEVNPAEEAGYFADPYKVFGSGGVLAGGLSSTNGARRVRLNEVELLRERREGGNPDEATLSPRKPEPDLPLVQDPVLARALDLLKGLAVVRQARF